MSHEHLSSPHFEAGDFVDYLAMRWTVAEVIEDRITFLRLSGDNGMGIPKVAAADVLKVNPDTGRQYTKQVHLRVVRDSES